MFLYDRRELLFSLSLLLLLLMVTERKATEVTPLPFDLHCLLCDLLLQQVPLRSFRNLENLLSDPLYSLCLLEPQQSTILAAKKFSEACFVIKSLYFAPLSIRPCVWLIEGFLFVNNLLSPLLPFTSINAL